MKLAEDTKPGREGVPQRAAVRVNSRLRIAVEWSEGGQTRRAEGYTRDISPKGCLAVVPQLFSVGDRLRLLNLENKNACEALLVWRGHEGRAGWELGLEFQHAAVGFWGSISEQEAKVMLKL